jgi:predicted acylesterase/phospholipase RssA
MSGAPLPFTIAFEGCACRAAFHVGAMEWFAEHDLHPTAVAGASSGSLIAAAIAIGRIGDLRAVWEELYGTPVYSPRHLLRGRWPWRMSEIVGGVATKYFGDRRLADTSIPLSIVVSQWCGSRFHRRTLTASDDITIARAVLASCFFPGPYSRHVPIDRRLTVDGAWLGRVPVVEAFALSARLRQASGGQVIVCVGDDEGRLLRGALRPRPMTIPASVNYRVLAPVEPLPLGAFDFDGDRTRQTMAIGRASAEAFVSANREWLGYFRS